MTRVGAAPLVGQDADQVVLACSTVQYSTVQLRTRGRQGWWGGFKGDEWVPERCIEAWEMSDVAPFVAVTKSLPAHQ